MTTHPGITFGILKRKLPAAKGESSNSQRPAKKQRLFTTTPEEMVKIFAQYMQAQGASYGRSVQPARGLNSPEIKGQDQLLHLTVQKQSLHL